MKKADEQVQMKLQSQMTDLGNWAGEIVAATAKRVVSLRLFFSGNAVDLGIDRLARCFTLV